MGPDARQSSASRRRRPTSGSAIAWSPPGSTGTYPAGLAVAEVIDIDRDTGQMFARIACKPLAGVDRSKFLLVLGHEAALPPRPEEATEVDGAKRAAAAGRGEDERTSRKRGGL